MIMKLAMQIGYLIAGVLGEYIPVHYLFLGSSVMFILIVFIVVRTPIIKFQ
jgi:chromate transport protein ChrA